MRLSSPATSAIFRDRRAAAAMRRAVPTGASLFLLAADGRVMSLTLRSCDPRLPKLLGPADATEHFDFPIRQRELEKLFGTPETLRYGAILLDKCRC